MCVWINDRYNISDAHSFVADGVNEVVLRKLPVILIIAITVSR